MRLLLTSDGITTDQIAARLEQLVRLRPNRKVAFIPTATNTEPGHKDWFLGQVDNLRKYGYGHDYIDVVDPSAPGVDWQARLEPAGIIFVSGGDAGHLLLQLKITGCDKWLYQRLQEDKIVYVGASAGSMITGPTLDGLALYLPKTPLGIKGLQWVDFEILPHVGKDISAKKAQTYAASCNHAVFALSDAGAVTVFGNAVEATP